MSPLIELSSFLAAIRRRWRRLTLLRAATVAATGVAIVLAAFALVFWLARPPADVLLGLAPVVAVICGAWAARALAPWWRVPDDRRLARFIEERRPEFGDSLVAAVEARQRDSAFANAIVTQAAIEARQVSPEAIVRRDEWRRAAGRGALACLFLMAAGGASVEPAHRAWDAAAVRLFPSRLEVRVEPGDVRLLAGHPLELRARVSGLPAGFDGTPTATLRAGTETRHEPMRRDGDRFVLALPAVEASFTYDVSVAGARSASYTVTVLRPPGVRGIEVAYTYPAYTGLPARRDEDGGDIYAPAGTRVTVRVRADKPLRSGALQFGNTPMPLEPVADGTSGTASFVVQRDGAYRVTLLDTDGLASVPSPEYFVRVTDDRPPDIRIVRPEGDRTVTALEEVQIDARAEDDFRLAALELVYAVGAGAERVVSLARQPAPVLAGGHLLYVEDLQVEPGDVIRVYARTREARGRGAREARSEMLLLEVRPFDQEFALAQSQSGGAAGGSADLESLIQAQKTLINATWNLLRRESAGRSAADLAALATAQGELKARAEGLAGRARAEGRDPLGEAAAAMGRAEGVLRQGRLQDAIPHEMAALTELTRAEAEDRRREVAQRRASSGGGGRGRSSQDMSALFDRELLRQQQTNYEDRTSSSSPQGRQEQESDAQARIRELARRQDELARAQRDLASRRMSEEERRRQLERLTREQEELRQQAEQLARDMSRQGRGQEQAKSLREAADEMRAASGELRRQDAESAAERGGRAAERLRGAEPSSEASGGAASFGELHLEAQQLADAQRRLEEQMRGEGAGQERLADEQERLASRADGLERSARAAAAAERLSSQQRQAAREAAGTLSRERVGERMRENAEALREGGSRPTTDDRDSSSGQRRGTADDQRPAEADRPSAGQTGTPPDEAATGATPGTEADPRAGEPSSALTRAAEQLGAAADAETRRAAAEMAKNQAARERLDEMQRRLERATRDGEGEIGREIEAAEGMLRDLGGDSPQSGAGQSTPEAHEYSTSAPGRESFKQDFSRWEQLKRDIEHLLEARDLAIARQLAGRDAAEALAAGSVPALPDAYREQVARYFELLGRAGRRP
jgi:hypothetical protein